MGGVAWTQQEDELLKKCIDKYGEGKWHRIPLLAGLNRCRKSCRLRWLNYLRPNIKRGSFSDEEVDIIIKLHSLVGNRWSLIASRLPGRTANDVKNYWNCHLSRKLNISRNKNENSSARNEQATMPEQHHTPDTTEVQSCDHQEAPSCYNVQAQDQLNAVNSIREEIKIEKTGQMFDGDNHVYDGKFDVEDPGVLMDILPTEFGFHGEIKVSEDAESSACYKWDMEDLIFGMGLWGDSTY